MKELRINHEIKAPKIRLILEDGSQAGVVNTLDALNQAEEQGLTLVEIGASAEPPVCKIMDYGKYKFEQRKREREHKKKQTTIQVKELTMGPSIEQHDYEVKLRKAQEFLKEGNRLKLTVRFKGRQILHREQGEEVLKRFEEGLKDFGTSEKGLLFEGKRMILSMQPKKSN